MAKLMLDENTPTLIITRTLAPKKVSLRLDALRIVLLFMPGDRDWRYAQTTAHHALIDLNILAAADMAVLREELAEVEEAAEIKLFLEDYAGHYATLTLQDIRESEIDLLQELAEHRRARRDRLAGWTRNVPTLIITGFDGDMATFDSEGIRVGPDSFLPWAELDQVTIQSGPEDGVAAYHLVPRQGLQSEYVVRMPDRKGYLFLAECTFWRTLAARQAEDAAEPA